MINMNENGNSLQDMYEKISNGRKYLSFQKTSWYALGIIAAFFIVSEIVGILMYVFDLSNAFNNNATVYYGMNALFEVIYLGVPLMIVLASKRGNIKNILRLSPMSGYEIFLTLIIAGAAFFANIFLTEANYLVASIFADISIPASPEIVNIWDRLSCVFLLVIVAPVMEELAMRGVMQRGLEGKSKWFSILITGIFFGLLHLSYYSFIPKVLMGILMCYIVYITDSIYSSIIIHMVNNGVSAIMSIATSGVADNAGDAAGAIGDVPIASILVSVFICLAISIGCISLIVGLLMAIKSKNKIPQDDGTYLEKGHLREKLHCELKIRWYSYLPIIISLLILVAYTVGNFIAELK